VEQASFLSGEKKIRFWPNLRALGAIFLLSGGKETKLQSRNDAEKKTGKG